MEAQYKCRNGRLLIKVEAGDQKGLFKQIAGVEDVFDAATTCGLCGSNDLSFRTRTVDGNDYYDLACRKCHATMRYGQHKTGGTLFPKSEWKIYKPEPEDSGY
jgi:hypothetical protein